MRALAISLLILPVIVVVILSSSFFSKLTGQFLHVMFPNRTNKVELRVSQYCDVPNGHALRENALISRGAVLPHASVAPLFSASRLSAHPFYPTFHF